MKKKNLFYILFLFISHFSISQSKSSVNAVYLDSLFDIASEKDYKYIRIIKDYDIPDKESYDLTYFYKSGNIAMSGATTSRTSIVETGTFAIYYENGNRKTITNYKNGKPYGSCFDFYEDGNKKMVSEWCDAPDAVIRNKKIKSYWDANSNLVIKDGNGHYEEKYTKKWKGFSKGKIKNNLKDSIWIGEIKKPNFKFTEKYKAGKLISGVSIDSSGMERKYKEVMVSAHPRKGILDFADYLAKKINLDKLDGFTGQLTIDFVVQEDGTVSDCKIVKDIIFGTGQEAVGSVLDYKDWIPTVVRGVKVKQRITMPINFKHKR